MNARSTYMSETDRIAQASDERQQRNQQDLYDRLRELGGGSVMRDETVTYIDGSAIGLPADPRMTEPQAVRVLQAKIDADAQTFAFNKVFDYKPFDGAYVTQLVFKELFGLAANGKATHSFFGTTPPQIIEIKTGPNTDDRVSAPWGELSLQYRDTELTIQLGAQHDSKKGWLFAISFQGPKKYETDMRGLCRMIEEKLKTHSIYKGKAVRIERGAQEPIFVDPHDVNPNKVAYAADVREQLNLAVFGPLQCANEFRKLGIPLDTKTLVHGRYGTGKTLALKLTARQAVENGWTFIQGKAGEDNVEELFELARLYAPAVVAIEDIDVLVKNSVSEDEQKRQISRLLDAFDGQTKGKEIMSIMTTNFYDSLPKGMTRPGRIDHPIEIGFPDAGALKHLVEANFTGGEITGEVDYEKLLAAFEGFTPAFIVSTLNDVRRAAVIRRTLQGQSAEDNTIIEADFIAAANGKRAHVEHHENAQDRQGVRTLGDMFEGLVRDQIAGVINNRQIDMNDGEIMKVDSQLD